jgi:uncharacterized membrane protein
VSDEPRHGRAAADEKETARIEAFSDGVFAIAITLLILELKIPHDVPEGQLLSALLHEWPAAFSFVVSFLTIGIMWVNHHRLFTLIRRSDDGLLLFNGLLLFAITFVPFPTAVVSEYLRSTDARLAATFYSLTGVVISIFFNLLWRYAAKDHRLLGDRISVAAAEDLTKQYRFGPVFYLVAVGVSQLNAIAGIGVNLALAIFFAFPPAVMRKKA